jgi:hypothetical protein
MNTVELHVFVEELTEVVAVELPAVEVIAAAQVFVAE